MGSGQFDCGSGFSGASWPAVQGRGSPVISLMALWKSFGGYFTLLPPEIEAFSRVGVAGLTRDHCSFTLCRAAGQDLRPVRDAERMHKEFQAELRAAQAEWHRIEYEVKTPQRRRSRRRGPLSRRTALRP